MRSMALCMVLLAGASAFGQSTFTGKEPGLTDQQRTFLAKGPKIYKDIKVAQAVAQEAGKPVAYFCSESKNPLDVFRSAKARATANKLAGSCILIADTNSRTAAANGQQQEIVDKVDANGKKLVARIEMRNSDYDGTSGVPYIAITKLTDDSAEKLLASVRTGKDR